MTAGEQLAQAMVEFLAFFMPAFIVFVVIEWAMGFFRADH